MGRSGERALMRHCQIGHRSPVDSPSKNRHTLFSVPGNLLSRNHRQLDRDGPLLRPHKSQAQGLPVMTTSLGPSLWAPATTQPSAGVQEQFDKSPSLN